jgi:hypothetical protein
VRSRGYVLHRQPPRNAFCFHTLREVVFRAPLRPRLAVVANLSGLWRGGGKWIRILDKLTFPVILTPFAELDLSNFAQKAAPAN